MSLPRDKLQRFNETETASAIQDFLQISHKKYGKISSSLKSSISCNDLSLHNQENDAKFCLENKIKTLEYEIEKLENRIIVMENTQQCVDQKHTEKMLDMSNKYYKSVIVLADKCTELDEITNKFNAKSQMVEKLEKQCKQLRKTVDDKEDMLSQCTNDNKELEKQMELLKNNTLLCNDLQQNLKSLKQMNFFLENENDRLKCVEREKIAILTELSSVKNTKNELEMKLDQNIEMSLVLQKENESSKKEVHEPHLQIGFYKHNHMEEKGALEDKINERSASLMVQDKTLTKLEEELKTSEITLKKAEKEHLHQVNQLTSEYINKATNAQSSCYEKEFEVSALLIPATELQDELNERNHVCGGLKASVRNSRQDIVELDSLQVELNATIQMVSEYHQKLSSQEEECERIEVGMTSNVSEYSEKLSKEECKKLEVGENNYDTIEALKTRLFKSEYEVERLNKANADLESQVLACQQQVKYLENQIALQEESMRNLKEKNLAEIENVRSNLLNDAIKMQGMELPRTEVENPQKIVHQKQEEHSRIVAEVTCVTKKLCEENEALMVPFRDPTQAYEPKSHQRTTENCLNEQRQDKCANIIGHQNPEEKIKHMAVPENQIFEQKDKIETPESTVATQQNTIHSLKNKSAATGGKKSCSTPNHPKGKENTNRNVTTSSTTSTRVLRSGRRFSVM